MDIITDEPDPVDEQEDDGVLQAEGTLPNKEGANAEEHRGRNPTEVEQAAQEIQERPMMLQEVFICGKNTRNGRDTEERLLRLVDVLNVDGIDHIVGIDPHPIVGDGKQNERNQYESQLARLAVGEEEQHERSRNHKVGRHQSHKQIGNDVEEEPKPDAPGTLSERRRREQGTLHFFLSCR